MSLTGFRQHPLSRRVGRAAGEAGKRLLEGALDLVLPVPANRDVASLRGVRRILVVRPNFRIGNALMTAPLVEALRGRFPGAEIDALVGDTTVALLAGLPISRIHCVSRGHVLRPWRFVALFVGLRREGYDLAVECGLGSFSGGLYTYLTGARHRLGREGRAARFLDVRVPEDPPGHAYDDAVGFARAFGAVCADRPVYHLEPSAVATAADLLAFEGLAHDGRVRPFAALFVGGHQAKRWPIASWRELAARLRAAGIPVALLVGPEERAAAHELATTLPDGARLVSPQPLPVFAGLLASAALVVTPDSGPMHLAVALGTPTIAILQSPRSEMYAPRGPRDRRLMRPTAGEVAAVVIAHPTWSEDSDRESA